MIDYIVQSCRTIRSFDESRPMNDEILAGFVNISRLTASAANRQPLKYRLITGDECKKIQPLTAWAAALSIKLPPEGKMPTGFILICHDTSVSGLSDSAMIDVGIAAQTLVLAAAEQGIGSCMIASFKRAETAEVLGLSENLVPKLLIAFGYPAETAVLCAPRDGDVTYFRDDAGVHFVPKRPLDEVIIKKAEE